MILKYVPINVKFPELLVICRECSLEIIKDLIGLIQVLPSLCHFFLVFRFLFLQMSRVNALSKALKRNLPDEIDML